MACSPYPFFSTEAFEIPPQCFLTSSLPSEDHSQGRCRLSLVGLCQFIQVPLLSISYPVNILYKEFKIELRSSPTLPAIPPHMLASWQVV
jgi:hypothetical protein